MKMTDPSKMSTFFRQAKALTGKNIRVALIRHPRSTIYRAFVMVIAFTSFLSYAKSLFIPVSNYGIGNPAPIQSLASAIPADRKLVFVNNGLGSQVDDLINRIADPVRQAGREVVVLDDELGLLTTCKQSLQGSSHCYGAVVFNNLSTGSDNQWNYTLRADSALTNEGKGVNVDKHSNAAQTYFLPLQLAVDNAILGQDVVPEEYMYTSITEEQRKANIRIKYMGGIINVLAVAFFIGMVGVSYQQVGMMATEREIGLSQIMTCMGVSQRARIYSYHAAFSIMYGPGWIAIALILAHGVFQQTSVAIVLVYHILCGLALASFSLFGGAFFKKAQLSGISVTLISMLLGVVAQATGKSRNGVVAVLSLIFPSMNYVYHTILMARFERQDIGTNLIKAAPENTWKLPGIVLWAFLIIQIIVYPILAGLIENWLYGTASKARTVGTAAPENAIEILGFNKTYPPNWWARKGQKKEPVFAVKDFTGYVRKGFISTLLGGNGAGKTTTLEAIAGLSTITDGEIRLGGSKSDFGICPQKNVLWDDLSVQEHIQLWSKLKSGDKTAKSDIEKLIYDCDLKQKRKALSKTLSGGQKRKLQLAIMFAGDSLICAIDEVSSGLDPLSRRKIWDILLAERGRRTMILTTHYLDESDLLSDHIFIMSKGALKCEGSSAELKSKLGGGYRVHGPLDAPEIEGVTARRLYDETVYMTETSASAGLLVAELERQKVQDYYVNSATIEDVFLRVSDETASAEVANAGVDEAEKPGVQLYSGKSVGIFISAWVLFRKRVTILKRNYFPMVCAVIIPIAAAAITMHFLNGFTQSGCGVADDISFNDLQAFDYTINVEVVLGPPDVVNAGAITKFQNIIGTGNNASYVKLNISSLENALHVVNTYDDFTNTIMMDRLNITPGGAFLPANQTPTLAFKANSNNIFYAITALNVLDNLRDEAVTIITTYADFDLIFGSGTGDTLQFITYFGLAMSVYPAFFVLYPTLERLRNVRALHYSNGVRALPLWAAYTFFDFLFVMLISVVATIIFAASTSVWYGLGYLFVVLFLYGLTSVLLVSVISLLCKSQLAAFAIAAGYQAVLFLLYMISYLSVLTYAPIQSQAMDIDITHYCIALISPVASLQRGLFASLNLFQILCRGDRKIAYPGDIRAYGGSIVYLTLQSVFLFSLLVWWESGAYRLRLKRHKAGDEEIEMEAVDKDISEELHRIDSINDGLRVLHVSKTFGKNKAVQNVSFGVSRGEIFSLLGPNGAGKSTTISMIRGDITIDEGEVFVENISMRKRKHEARQFLGTCPQFDAIDQLSVMEHLRFYARIRGVPDVEHNVQEVLQAVGLSEFKSRMASKLSGGNKRKLSLGIALMGNPSVVLLDEPSSGQDAASKRIMWKTLTAIAPGRSIVLTTHSMEESEHLSKRAGIISKKMLALGSTNYLRKKYGDAYHIHLVLHTAPNTTDEETESVKAWLVQNFHGAKFEDKSFHGQIKFEVPSVITEQKAPEDASDTVGSVTSPKMTSETTVVTKKAVSALFAKLEEHKQELGIEYYSVGRTTLEEVFLSIVGKDNAAIEEGYDAEEEEKKKKWNWLKLKKE